MRFICVLTCFMLILLGNSFAESKEAPASKSDVSVVFETSMGSFTLKLRPDKAPITVKNFLAYVDSGFYSNTVFHRVIPGFMAQGGGFEKGMKRKKNLAPIKNESTNGLKNVRGSISMARTSNPDSATSQFFINVNNNASLDGQAGRPGYAVFGNVTKGMDVVDKIVNTPTGFKLGFRDVPKTDVVIKSVKRVKAEAKK